MTDREELQAALSRLGLLCADYAGLIAACRAAAAADARGDPDPLVYVRDLLAGRGQLPAPGASPLVTLADGRTAMHMAGWPVVRGDGHVTPTCPAWPRHDSMPVLAIADAVTSPGDTFPPYGAPCGCLWEAGRSKRRTRACPSHPDGQEVIPPRLSRVALYELVLDGTPPAAGAARSWVRQVLAGCPASDNAVAALSELVANSAVHSRSRGRAAGIRIRLTAAPREWLHLEVKDEGTAGARRIDTAKTRHDDSRQSATVELPEHGFGMRIVAALTNTSGRQPGTAWFATSWNPLPATVPGQRRRGGETAVKEPA